MEREEDGQPCWARGGDMQSISDYIYSVRTSSLREVQNLNFILSLIITL
jgi:hypothetical protein